MPWIPTLERRWNRSQLALAITLTLLSQQTARAQGVSWGEWTRSILQITGKSSDVTEGTQGLARFLLFFRSPESNEMRSPSCSASRIGKGVFLTARHCLTPIERRGAKPARTLTFKDAPAPVNEWILGDGTEGKLPAEIRVTYSATGLKAVRAYTLEASNRDIAIIITENDESDLEEELTIFKTRELSFASKEGRACTVLKAYGFAASDQPRWGYFCRAQNQMPNDLYFFAARTEPLVCGMDPTLLAHAELGDSGGPATLANAAGDEEIVGVLSHIYTAIGETRKQTKMDSLVGLKYLMQAAQEYLPKQPSAEPAP